MELIIKRAYKDVYRNEDTIIKMFAETHPKASVFNEALTTVRAEETGLNVPKIRSVEQIDGKWSLVIEYIEGKTLEELIQEHPENLETYMEMLVDLQIEMFSKKVPKLKSLRGKLERQINGLKEVDATTRYELLTRLDSMPNHEKLCHGDFTPSNIIVAEDGTLAIVDWAHATHGNASADAAMTYLHFALKDQKTADLYMRLFCKKSDTARQYVQQWLPIVAASQLTRDNTQEVRDFLFNWIDVIDFQ